MITAWRHNDEKKSEKVFREEVQKEFERLYNLDGRGDAFDKAVKDAIGRLLDPKNPKGWGTDGIPGGNGRDGQGGGRDGTGSGKDGNGGDGRGNNGRDGTDGRGNGGNGGGNQGGLERLTQFNVLGAERSGEIGERTSPFATMAPVNFQGPSAASGSGLVWDTGTSEGYYAPDRRRSIAHGVTSQWFRFPEKPLNETRLFMSSYQYADWTTPDNIAATFPKAIDIDGTLKFPYIISDVGADSWGHLQKVKITNVKTALQEMDDPTLLEPLRLWNTGVAWYTGTNDDILFPNSNPEAKYDGRTTRWIGHGDTSNWTVGRTPGVAYDPVKGNYNPDHRFYSGDWDNPVRTNPNQLNTWGSPPPYSVLTDLNADDWGHVQYAITQEMQKLNAGRGLQFADGHTWYNPAKQRTIEHPLKNIQQTFINSQLDFFYPIGFGIDDSGHWDSITWARLPLMQGEKGDKGDAAILNAAVIATNTLPPGSAASVLLTQPPTSTPSNRFFEFTFNIPRGKDGEDGEDGVDGKTPIVNAFVLNTTTLPAGSPATASVANFGSTLAPNFGFSFGIPQGPSGGGGGGGDPINNYYTTINNPPVEIQNIGSFGFGSTYDWVLNPGTNSPFQIKRIATTNNDSVWIQDPGTGVLILRHRNSFSTWVGDWPYSPGSTHFGSASLFQAYDNGDGTWTFPGFEVNDSGHIINAFSYSIPIGGGGGGGGTSYNWNVGIQGDISPVPTGNTVRFLSQDSSKLKITKSGLDITFNLEEALKKLTFGNALSQDPNSAQTAGLAYDPYVGMTIHVNNNTRDLAGVVKKGSDPSVKEQTTKVWGTNTNNDPNWRPTEEVEGDNIYIAVEPHPTKPNTKVIRWLGL